MIRFFTAALCFVLPLVYWHGIQAPGTTTKWIFVSLVVPFLCAFVRGQKWSESHSWGALFLAWSAVSLLWATSLPDGILRLWHFALLGGAFVLGANLTERFWRWSIIAFGLALAINGLLGLAQLFENLGEIFGWLDWPNPLVTTTRFPAGLFVNATHAAEASLMASVALIFINQWVLAGFAFIPFLLASAKGTWAALIILLWWVVYRSKRILALAAIPISILGVLVWVGYIGPGSEMFGPRITLYLNTIAGIFDAPFIGHGIGSFWSQWPVFHDAVIPSHQGTYAWGMRPQTAHNDILNVIFENGLIGLLAAVLFFWSALIRPINGDGDRAAQIAVIVFLLLGLTSFPLYMPATAVFAFLACGYLSRCEVSPRFISPPESRFLR